MDEWELKERKKERKKERREEIRRRYTDTVENFRSRVRKAAKPNKAMPDGGNCLPFSRRLP